MDGRRFDDITRSVGRFTSRREVIKGLAGTALAGVVAVRAVGGAGAATLSCNSNEKCEAKCGRENAICCNGKCILGGCGPDRSLNLRTCTCCRVDERGRPTNTGCTAAKYCGA